MTPPILVLLLACTLTTRDAEDAATIAARILDDSLPAQERQTLIQDHLDRAGALVAAMADGLPAGNAKEEYRRIPWIWRVAIAAGKRNEAKSLHGLLEVSLPKPNEKLRDWQAVVIGGGLINGISQAGQWPQERMGGILKGNEALSARWKDALTAAAAMVEDEKVPTGTRYDALRMIALDPAQERREQLAKFLAKGTNGELQMGAVSGMSDIDAHETAPLLIENLDNLTAGNRVLAVDALLRSDARVDALLTAMEQRKIAADSLSPAHITKLRSHMNTALRERAGKLLPKD